MSPIGHSLGMRSKVHPKYKSILGDRLCARHPKSQETEATIACNILNRMIDLGKPESFAIAD